MEILLDPSIDERTELARSLPFTHSNKRPAGRESVERFYTLHLGKHEVESYRGTVIGTYSRHAVLNEIDWFGDRCKWIRMLKFP
jgi:hypothetical protein